MVKLLVIEYEEGCGFNCKTICEDGYEYWASKRPFNRVEMQNRINRFLKDNLNGIVEQEMIYSLPFNIKGK